MNLIDAICFLNLLGCMVWHRYEHGEKVYYIHVDYSPLQRATGEELIKTAEDLYNA